MKGKSLDKKDHARFIQIAVDSHDTELSRLYALDEWGCVWEYVESDATWYNLGDARVFSE